MQLFVTVCWLLLALIHFFPALAFFRPSLIEKLYGVKGDDLVLSLLQHRAALFLIVFASAACAAFIPSIRDMAVLITGFSMLSFIYVYLTNQRPILLKGIFIIDLLGLAPLLVVGIASIQFIR